MEDYNVKKNETEPTQAADNGEHLVGEVTAITEEDNAYLVIFKKPVTWEGSTYTEVDLSSLENLKASDMIQVQRTMEKSGSVSVLPELSLEYALLFAAKATKIPVEFFQSLPPKEAIKVKNRVTSFFFGED
jgi:hypothetical protein